MPVRYVWASIHGYYPSVDPCMAPHGRKGSMEKRLNGDNKAVFTGHLAGSSPPPSIYGEEVRKGEEHGENPWATGDGLNQHHP